MRMFGFLYRLIHRVPTSTSSVHPASNGHDLACSPSSVQRAKIREMLGVTTLEECREVDDLLNRSNWQTDCFPLTDQDSDEDSIDTDYSEESEEADENFPNQRCLMADIMATKPVLPLNSSVPHGPSMVKLGEEHSMQRGLLMDPFTKATRSFRTSEKHATGRPVSIDISFNVGRHAQGQLQTYRLARPSRSLGIKENRPSLSKRHSHGHTSQQTFSPRSNRDGGKRSSSHANNFPLPAPNSEKHYLPSPRTEGPCVAHPLPMPVKASSHRVSSNIDDREQVAAVRAVSPLRRAPSCDPLGRSTLQGAMGSLVTPPRTPPNTPPATPRSHLHLKSPPTATRPSPVQSKAPPAKLHLQVHPQVAVNMSNKSPSPPSPSPPSSKRHSPRFQVPSHKHNQSPLQFPALHIPSGYSPLQSPTSRPMCPRKWTKGMVLGQGTFGTVYEGLNLEDGSFFAVKVSSQEDVSPEIQQEVDLLSKLEHPNIVRYLGSSFVDKRLCIFLELVRMGSLDSICRKFKRFGDRAIRSYTRQILCGLAYLHAKETIHRDIKCANILVDVNGQVKLADFGIAKEVGEALASSVKGTPLYMAPEVLLPNKDCYSYPADIWSLGCTVLEMADGKPPWSDLEGFGFFFKVKAGELPPMPEHLSCEGKDFIRRCLKFNPKDRPTASELLQHPFVLNVATPEIIIPWSPPSPVSPVVFPQQFPDSASNTWACGQWYPPSSPTYANCFDGVLVGSQRAQTLLYGR